MQPAFQDVLSEISNTGVAAQHISLTCNHFGKPSEPGALILKTRWSECSPNPHTHRNSELPTTNKATRLAYRCF